MTQPFLTISILVILLFVKKSNKNPNGLIFYNNYLFLAHFFPTKIVHIIIQIIRVLLQKNLQKTILLVTVGAKIDTDKHHR